MNRNRHMWIEKNSRPVIVGACLQRCHIWASLQVLHFNWNMCLNVGIEEEKNFAQWQLNVGHRKHMDDFCNIKLLDCLKLKENTVKTLIHHIYSSLSNLQLNPPFYEMMMWMISTMPYRTHGILLSISMRSTALAFLWQNCSSRLNVLLWISKTFILQMVFAMEQKELWKECHYVLLKSSWYLKNIEETIFIPGIIHSIMITMLNGQNRGERK